MDIRLEHTDGLGRSAEVWLGGHLLRVCDAVSGSDAPHSPGLLENVKLTYIATEGFSWDQAAVANSSRRKMIEPVQGWSYLGFGQVLSIMPVVIDFGLVEMEDANWTNDERLAGRYVRIPIDRLEISYAQEPDWPTEIR